MSQCLPREVKEQIGDVVRDRLSSDALLCKSRLGILLEVLGESTSKSVYLQIVKCARQIELGGRPVPAKPPTKKDKAVARVRQEGIFSQAIQINSSAFRVRQLKRKVGED